jgi:uncharacterized protein
VAVVEQPAGSPFRQAPGGLELRCKVTPKAGRDRLAGLAPGPGGETWLAVKVGAPPEDGKANEAVMRLIAKQLGIAVSRVSLRAGATARWKTLMVDADPATVEARLAACLDEMDSGAGKR